MCWWLRVDPVQQASDDRLLRVVRWEDWPERPNIDLGIDLVGWDRLGRLWAVQCKAYQPENLVSKSEVAQLVAEATLKPRGLFHGRIFITASDGYTSNAKILAKKNRVLLLDRSHLEAGFQGGSGALRWPGSEASLRALLRGKTVARKSAMPWPHQKRAVQATLSAFNTASRGQLLMACGTGKTLTSLWIKEQILATRKSPKEPARVVVLLPSISLLAQTLREWATNRNTEWAALAVCSDATSNSSQDENYDDMEAVSAGFSVTTDRGVIRKFLRSVEKEQIIFSTYQSSVEVAAAARTAKVTFDLVICDEAHRLAGQAGKSYASILDEKMFPARRRLFMTATPKRFLASAKKKASDEGFVVASMDDPSKFGDVAHQIPFGEAIKKGLLTNYQVVIAVTTDTKAKELLEENRFVGLDGKTMTASDLAAAIAVAKAAKRHKITRAISFHSTIKRSKQFVDTLEKLCAEKLPGLPRVLGADHVDGSFSAKERQWRIDRLKAGATGFNLLANARCLTEGVDVPALDGVAFVDPRQSEVDIVQAVGRAIRLSPNKELGTIIVPVVCSAEEAAAGTLDAAGHKKLRQVLWALRAHDASLAVEIDDYVFAQALPTDGSRKSRLPERLKVEFDGDDLKAFAANIRTTVLKLGSPDADWYKRYVSACNYFSEHGWWPSEVDPNPSVARVGHWISDQRFWGKKLEAGETSRMTDGRYARLANTSGWVWYVDRDGPWEAQYRMACTYFATHGHWPSSAHSDPEIAQCGAWVSLQRRLGKKLSEGVENQMTRVRYERLASTPGWVWGRSFTRSDWDQQYGEACAYFAEYGSWPRASDQDQSIARLGRWCHTQRMDAKKFDRGISSAMSKERYDMLSGTVGWAWSLDRAGVWEQRYEAAVALYRDFGRWPEPDDAVAEHAELGKWCGQQRKLGRALSAGKESRLTLERYDKLNRTPGWLWSQQKGQTVWAEQYLRACAYFDEHARWPTSKNGNLGYWVTNQRTYGRLFREGLPTPMTAERYQTLDRTSGWVWVVDQDQSWNEQYRMVCEFYEMNGRWPYMTDKDEATAKLGNWVSRQRGEGRKLSQGAHAYMTRERYTTLDQTPGWLWQIRSQGE